MRRLRLFRRRAERTDPDWNELPEGDGEGELAVDDSYDAPIEPFVPVAAAGYDEYDADAAEDDEPAAPVVDAAPPRAPRRRLRLPRPRLRVRLPDSGPTLRLSVLLAALFLVAAGVFGTLLVQDRLQADIEMWWPLALVVVAGVWMLVALIRRQVALFLGGAGFAGVGLSLLLDTQDIAVVDSTLLGVVLVTVGLGIVIRGFLLRQRAPF